MIRSILLCSTVIACIAAFGQTNNTAPAPTHETCPIEVTNINPTGNDSWGHAMQTSNGSGVHGNDGRMFVLKVKNESGKDIKGMKFRVAYYDATEDLSDIPGDWQWTDPLKTGAEKSFRWRNDYRKESVVGLKVSPLKVLFEDGSTWEPAKPLACSLDYWRDKHHKS
jgi:hypothetical protein